MRVRSLFLGVAFAAVAALAFSGPLAAEEAAPAAPAATPAVPAAPATATAPAAKTEAPKSDTKTPSPVVSLLKWAGSQVAPNLDCPCPATADGEKAWRSWFDGGKDVPLATLRDAMVADGWTADRFVGFFKDVVAKKAASGDCAGKCGEKCDGDCSDAAKGAPASATAAPASADAKGGCCQGKGEKADGKPCCGGCKKKEGTAASTPTDKPADKPAETPKP